MIKLSKKVLVLMYNHVSWLEAEAIEIMREVVLEAENPVMLYSVGKDRFDAQMVVAEDIMREDRDTLRKLAK